MKKRSSASTDGSVSEVSHESIERERKVLLKEKARLEKEIGKISSASSKIAFLQKKKDDRLEQCKAEYEKVCARLAELDRLQSELEQVVKEKNKKVMLFGGIAVAACLILVGVLSLPDRDSPEKQAAQITTPVKTAAVETTAAEERGVIEPTQPLMAEAEATEEMTEPPTEPPTEPKTTAAVTERIEQRFILNTSRMVIHEPNCPAVDTMSPKNINEVVGMVEEFEAQGYKRCGRCKPQ